MKIELCSEDIKKILSAINLEDLEDKLEADWGYWDVELVSGVFELTKKVEKKK